MRNTICAIIGMFGLVLILGTAGSADLMRLSFTHLIIQSLVGLVMFVCAFAFRESSTED